METQKMDFFFKKVRILTFDEELKSPPPPQVYLNRAPNPRGRVMVPCRLEKPVPSCYVCSAKNEVNVQLNTATTTLGTLEEKVLKGAFNMVAPDVEVADGKGTILISSEPGETTHNLPKTLKEFSVVDGTRLNCDDFLQNYTLSLTILHRYASIDTVIIIIFFFEALYILKKKKHYSYVKNFFLTKENTLYVNNHFFFLEALYFSIKNFTLKL